MSRFMTEEETTPCPSRHSGSSGSGNLYPPEQHLTSFPLAARDDDTEDLDFTRAIPTESYTLSRRNKGLKQPPRRTTAYAPAARQDPNDHVKTKEKPADPPRPEPHAPVAAAMVGEEKHVRGLNRQPRRSIHHNVPGKATRARVSALLRARKEREMEEAAVTTEAVKDGSGGEGNNRRRDAPSQKNVNFQQSLCQEGKQLHAPPKRAPLQVSARHLSQEVSNDGVRDLCAGKENIPLGGRPQRKRANTSDKSIPSPTRKSARISASRKQECPKEARRTAQGRLFQRSDGKSLKRPSDQILDEDDSSFTSQSSGVSSKRSSSDSLRLIKRRKQSVEDLPTPPSLTAEEEAELLPPTDFLVPALANKPSLRTTGTRPLDPILADNLERCEMYEESWLSAQESSVSQLLNHLLAQYSPAPTGKPRLVLRKEFLQMYQSTPFPLVHNRVHASLLYGALSTPQHSTEKSSTSRLHNTSTNAGQLGWGSDIGLRQAFLDLVLNSYDQSTLITALEVVVGRDMFALAEPGESERRILERYIDRYIIWSEDLLVAPAVQSQKSGGGVRNKSARSANSSEDDDKGSPAWLLRRSCLRSLLLALLLDKAKSRGALGRLCLFKSTSTHKSSVSVVTALGRLLLPSVGDIYKTLSHLNYTLETEQGPLLELDYSITNIAVDIRNGVRLARVVEVLLHSKRRDYLSSDSTSDEEDWTLTPHLQYPATSRAQKLHNVSLVLKALDAENGNPNSVEAKDVVDGHREKTVGLLWSLFSRWGMELLVDWDMVKREIRRLETQGHVESKVSQLGRRDHTALLREWARCIAAKYQLAVKNLTTSFSDGRVFAAIIDEYQQYLPSLTGEKPASLEAKLRAVGCNSYFAGLFAKISDRSQVFSQDFVVSALAYLCSRLVQPSMRGRAATLIQRSYRAFVFRNIVGPRIRLLLVAYHCAEVVNTRQRVLDAAIIIQRAFRSYLHVKVDALIRRVTGIQASGRAFLTRRLVKIQLQALVFIQRRWREIRETRYQERIGVARGAIIGFQGLGRGWLLRRRVLAMKRAATTIGDVWKEFRKTRHLRDQYLRMRIAAVVIQRSWRRYHETRIERGNLLEVQRQVKVLQSYVKAVLVRDRFIKLRVAVVAIQSLFRRSKEATAARSSFLRVRQAATLLQRRWRETLCARKDRSDYITLKAAVRRAKALYLERKRVLIAAIIIQKAWRQRAWVIRMRRILQDAVVIQSAWRGYLARKQSAPRIRVIRKRLAKISESSTGVGDTIGAKTVKALPLLSSKAGFARGIQKLESYTAMSGECARLVACDVTALSAIAASIENQVPQFQKSPSSATARSLVSSLNVISKIAHWSSASAEIAARVASKQTSAVSTSKDIFAALLVVVQTLKSSPTKTAQYDMLLVTLRALTRLSMDATVRRRLCARKKWVEPLRAALKELTGAGRKRGAKADQAKEELLITLSDFFGA